MKYLVLASYLEIYNEEIRDLLGTDAKKKLDLKEHPDKGVYVQGEMIMGSNNDNNDIDLIFYSGICIYIQTMLRIGADSLKMAS